LDSRTSLYILSSYKATATTGFIISIQTKRDNSNIIYNVSTMLREINKTICSIWKLVSLLLKGNLEEET
jgi:hypothetical protein